MKTYSIKKVVDGYESKNTVLETGLNLEEAKLALCGHKKIVAQSNSLLEDIDTMFAFENENQAMVTYSIEKEI